MDALDGILGDWQACGADGVVLPAARVGAAVECVSWRVRTGSAAGAAQRDALELLAGPFVQLLRVAPGSEGGDEVVHFVRFWQASQEVWRRVHQEDLLEEDDPLIEELAVFRDALLRRFDSGGVTMAWLLGEVQTTRQMSVDAEAWVPLEEAVAEACATTRGGEQGKGVEVGAAADAGANLELDEVSMLLLAWLHELVEDSCRGLRSAKVSCVCDVAACGAGAAARQLGAAGWDVEDALRGLLGGSAGAPGDAWSSQGAKLRLNEVQCPICAVPYAEGAKSVVTRCCFQALCEDCRAAIGERELAFKCPFCRVVEENPLATGWRWAQSGARRVARPLAAVTIGPLDRVFIAGGRAVSRASSGISLGPATPLRRFGTGAVEAPAPTGARENLVGGHAGSTRFFPFAAGPPRLGSLGGTNWH